MLDVRHKTIQIALLLLLSVAVMGQGGGSRCQFCPPNPNTGTADQVITVAGTAPNAHYVLADVTSDGPLSDGNLTHVNGSAIDLGGTANQPTLLSIDPSLPFVLGDTLGYSKQLFNWANNMYFQYNGAATIQQNNNITLLVRNGSHAVGFASINANDQAGGNITDVGTIDSGGVIVYYTSHKTFTSTSSSGSVTAHKAMQMGQFDQIAVEPQVNQTEICAAFSGLYKYNGKMGYDIQLSHDTTGQLALGVNLHVGADSGVVWSNGTTTLFQLDTVKAIGRNIEPQTDSLYDLGSSSKRWRDLWLTSHSLHIGGYTLNANGTGLLVSGSITVLGNVTTTFGGDVTGSNAGSLTVAKFNGQLPAFYLSGSNIKYNDTLVTPSTAGSFQCASGQTGIVFIGSVTAITYTLNLPASPTDGLRFVLKGNGTSLITTLTVATTDGSSVDGLLSAGFGLNATNSLTGIVLIYHKSNNTWY